METGREVIQLGDQGDLVRCWQRIVHAKPDGVFGPHTDELVRIWQTSRGIEPDGVIGPLTTAALVPGDLIKPFEGLRLQTYDDHDGKPLKLVNGQWRRPDPTKPDDYWPGPIGYPTIGWGRLLHPGEYIEVCTRDEADKWFEQRLNSVEIPAINRYIPKNLPGERVAAASFCYNCGSGALAKLANSGFYKAFWTTYGTTTKGVKNAGLIARRAEEYALFSS